MSYGEIALVDVNGASGWGTSGGIAVADALTHQIAYHAAHHYRQTAMPVRYYSGALPKGSRAWPIAILANPDVDNALGWHDVGPNGGPYGRIFAEPTKAAGVSLSSVASHEALEAFVDPWANLWSDGPDGASVAFEACDPVEASAYQIGGVEVSNFVTRAWFDPFDTAGPFDQLGHLHAARTLEAGGYEIVMRDGVVTQRFAEDAPPAEWRRALKRSPQPSRTVWREVRVYVEG